MHETGVNMTKPSTSAQKSKDILRSLMDPTLPDAVPWSSSDLRAILDHQLDVQLSQEAARLSEASRLSEDRVRAITAGQEHATFGAILEMAKPEPGAVDLIKNYAKAAMRGDGDLPRDVARVLYLMAIVRGRLAGQHGVSSLDESSLKREINRCLTFGWLPDKVRVHLKTFVPIETRL